MTTTNRQNRLLLNEDWKKIYQSFRNADFQSYDFDNLRRTMIQYLRQNYPEDFNDYIDSSEYLALVDLIAFLGQNLSFRIDLNARENFLELAERRESVIRLARLLSYNPKRNLAANGLLKFETISTTEDIIDSNGFNLSRQTISWNDISNRDWNEQFIRVLNAALPLNNSFGSPTNTLQTSTVNTEQYQFISVSKDIPVYGFSKNISGQSTRFEIVSTGIESGALVEEPPGAGKLFSFVYRNDGQGADSNNTGFFSHFRQGRLDQGNFTIAAPSPNQIVSIDTVNVNNTDVWLYQLDANGRERDLWTKVDAVQGNNIIYNSINKKIRNVYSVLSRADDRISLIFSDGVFGNTPQGSFRVYYRVSDNRSFTVADDDLTGITVSFPYESKNGSIETLTIGYSLKQTVDNASPSESNESIKANAPSTYYTQNRIISGEDYNIAPLSVSQEIIKSKSINRLSSGISRYFDLVDATGKYSKTNLFGSDGIIYVENLEMQDQFSFVTKTDIEGIINDIIEPLTSSEHVRNFYYSEFPHRKMENLNIRWKFVSQDQNRSSGFFINAQGENLNIGRFTNTDLRFVIPGAMIRLMAPAGYTFSADGTIRPEQSSQLTGRRYMWVKVISTFGSGTTMGLQQLGPVVFNNNTPRPLLSAPEIMPVVSEIIPVFTTQFEPEISSQIIEQIFSNQTFGIRFDIDRSVWKVITQSNLSIGSRFSMSRAGDLTNEKQDASWVLLLQSNGEQYEITTRGKRYIFESDREIRFYFDQNDKIYDPETNSIVRDKITLLPINTGPALPASIGVDFVWAIAKEYRNSEGYTDTRKVEVGFFDSDDDGVVDDPELFDAFVGALELKHWVFEKSFTTYDGVLDYKHVDQQKENIHIFDNQDSLDQENLLDLGLDSIFYFTDNDVFKKYNSSTGSFDLVTTYRAFRGRDKVLFQYVHVSNQSKRIDPSSTNIIDVYLLTRQYDTQVRQFLNDTRSSMPEPPDSDVLFQSYGKQINRIKSISDEVIYHVVKYKVLFGKHASPDLRATFKIVKNQASSANDNELKSRVISAINQFFAVENWDFGDTFYFSELSAYVMNELAPDLAALVIVPQQSSLAFGDLFEIKSEPNEILISSATVNNIELVSDLTAARLRMQTQLS